MNFDPQTALNYAASISRPRRVGSAADEAVAAEIAEKLRGWGYEVEWQPFTFSAASEVFLKLFILASLLLVAALLIWRESVLAVGLVGLIALFMPLNRRVQSAALERNGHGLKWGQRYTAANLVARLPGRVQSGAQSSFEAEIASSHKEASHE